MAGRDETIRTVMTQLEEHRFVTIVGAGGIGKTHRGCVRRGTRFLSEFSGRGPLRRSRIPS